MSEEMVKRVASAVLAAFRRHDYPIDTPWPTMAARAAIEAMREPTDEMGDRYWKTRGGLKLTPSDVKNERPIEQRPLYASALSSTLQAPIETYTEICMNEKCPRGQGVPIEVVRLVTRPVREGGS